MKRFGSICLLIALALAGCSDDRGVSETAAEKHRETWEMEDKVAKTQQQWREELSPMEYRVLREKGTEPAYQNEYWDFDGEGVYKCAGCGLVLFSSDTKFACGSGWPSFYQAMEDGRIGTETDTRHAMVRTEVHCNRCGGHLGHVFEDGPEPTGLRYCINSASLDFQPADGNESAE
ncbi:MAG: peptide-methionine (R)-S-oxide reductase MsrB [Phycisphaerae bacterium]